ncbi:hypothetical protein ACWEQL_27055 [Kitasatospora sp. NPDC004240]
MGVDPPLPAETGAERTLTRDAATTAPPLERQAARDLPSPDRSMRAPETDLS